MAPKVGRNEPCWCGSGRKFKKCHLERESERQLPLEAVQNAAWREWDQKQCLHPAAAAGVCDKIILAHTVQRSRVLEALLDTEQHVLTFKRTLASALGSASVPRRVGWQVASTFTGFCAKHDASTFAPLETQTFEGSLEQCFLVGYRALCYEIYQKQGLIRSAPTVRRVIDRGMSPPNQREVQRAEVVVEAGARDGLRSMLAVKATMDQQLLAGTFSGWSRLVLRFRGDLSVAATGGVAPNRDLDLRELQVLHDPTSTKEQLMCGVTADDNVNAVVLLWPTDQRAPRRFVDSILSRGKSAVPSLLIQFMLVHLENTYFSSKWWESLSVEDRRHLTGLAMVMNPYYDAFSYSDRAFIPWEVLELELRDAA